MQWYYSKNGIQQGPVPQEVLVGKLRSGEISRGDLVWREGMPDWQPAGQILEISASVFAGSGAPEEASSPYAPPAPQAYPVPLGFPMAAPASGLAIASLVCGILSLVTCLFPVGIAAVICGHMALSNVAKSNGMVGGRGLAIGGLTTGYISIAISAIYLIFVIAIAVGSSL